MKISVSSYSFDQLLRQKLHTQYSLIPLAKSIGFDGIEFTDLTPPDGMTEEEYALLIRKESERVGIKIVAYTVYANLLAENEVERLKKKIDVASILGAPVLRHDIVHTIPDGFDFDENVPYFAKVCKEVSDYAKEKGIITCTENHGRISQNPNRVKAIIDKANTDNFKWLVDVGNFLCDDCDPVESVKIGAPYCVHAHVKDFRYDDESGFKTSSGKFLKGMRIGTGVVPVKECVKILLGAGYDGYFTIEYEGSEPCVQALKESIDYILEK